jgi:hypothetical protein
MSEQIVLNTFSSPYHSFFFCSFFSVAEDLPLEPLSDKVPKKKKSSIRVVTRTDDELNLGPLEPTDLHVAYGDFSNFSSMAKR